ncbi:hypothetical protein sos41_15400 [Alphaproteobacteria bacterium SO-S41]|nr:hypothetical protein sos41_15400 [Alphaproteobacteria bacterium SO-S41]
MSTQKGRVPQKIKALVASGARTLRWPEGFVTP